MPRPRPAPTPKPKTRAGTFTYTGARSLWLVDEEGRSWRVGDKIAPGRYDIRAVFDGRPGDVKAGEVVIGASKTTKITCTAAFMQCRAN